MKVLVSTSETQGTSASDFNYCVDGELVWIAEPCATDKQRLPNGCGCGRAFAGLSSQRATTTAVVADLPMNYAEYVEALRSGLSAQGWPGAWAVDLAAAQTTIAGHWPVGAVIERDLDILSLRALGDHR